MSYEVMFMAMALGIALFNFTKTVSFIMQLTKLIAMVIVIIPVDIVFAIVHILIGKFDEYESIVSGTIRDMNNR